MPHPSTPAPDPAHASTPASPPDELAAWKTGERQTVFVSDDPHLWRMLSAAWLGETVDFKYWGGSTPGAARRFTPIRVFRVEGLSAVYAEGHCGLRGDSRVFRMDRIAWNPTDAPL